MTASTSPSRKRRRWAGGSLILAAAFRGIEEALHGPRDREAVVVADAGGDPPHPDFELLLPPDHSQAQVILRQPVDATESEAQ